MPEHSQGAHEQEGDDHRKTLEVTVHNEDNGEVVTISGHPNTPVSEIVDEMYGKFGLERQPGDRLRCEGDGGDVLSHEGEHLNEYSKRFCSALVWLFAGDQGGARGHVAAR